MRWVGHYQEWLYVCALDAKQKLPPVGPIDLGRVQQHAVRMRAKPGESPGLGLSPPPVIDGNGSTAHRTRRLETRQAAARKRIGSHALKLWAKWGPCLSPCGKVCLSGLDSRQRPSHRSRIVGARRRGRASVVSCPAPWHPLSVHVDGGLGTPGSRISNGIDRRRRAGVALNLNLAQRHWTPVARRAAALFVAYRDADQAETPAFPGR